MHTSGAEELEEIQKEIQERLGAFVRSTQHSELSTYQQKNSDKVVTLFAEFMYEDCDQTIDEWNSNAVYVVLMESFPRKVDGEPGFFDAIGPILIAFLLFLSEKNLQPNALKLIEKVELIQKKVQERALDPQNIKREKKYTV